MLYIDPTYNSSFTLLHENYRLDAVRVPMGTKHIEVFLLHPLDLVVSKIARFNGSDPDDIRGLIVKFGIRSKEIHERAEQALGGYVGNVEYLRMNLREVLKMADELASGVAPDAPGTADTARR